MSRTPFVRADAVMTCTHELGVVGLKPSQEWVTIEGVPILVDDDPEQRPIAGCPFLTVSTKPCTRTLAVDSGYSDFIRIDGSAACLSTVMGRTDGTGGTFQYLVKNPAQEFVAEASP